MIILRINTNKKAPKVAIVGCLHGNEILGKEVFTRIAQEPTKFENLVVVIANVPAYQEGVRYIDRDLNRSFPGSINGNHEERLAAEIIQEVEDADFVVDIHTTTSPGFKSAAISGVLDDRKRSVISSFNIDTVAVMDEKVLKSSLIGNVTNGISIEYGLEVIDEAIVENILKGIIQLQAGKYGYSNNEKPLDEYKVIGTIPKNHTAALPLQNLVYSEDLNGYPFILDEENYTDMRGFLLDKLST